MRVLSRVLIAMVLIAPATPAFAQDPDERQLEHKGFHASIGLGAGWSSSRCADCNTAQQTAGPTLTLRAGGALTPNVVMSFEYTAQAKTSDITSAVALWGSLVAQWYPRAHQGFFVSAGGGFAVHNEDVKATEFAAANVVADVEFGYQAGVGYDIRLSRGTSITPFVDFLDAVGSRRQVNSGTETAEKVGAQMVHAGVAVSWR
jgi:hypothetical protein